MRGIVHMTHVSQITGSCSSSAFNCPGSPGNMNLLSRKPHCFFSKGRYTLLVFTGRVYGPWTWVVHGPWTRVSNTGVILDTRVHGPYSPAPVHTTVNTGSVYRASVSTGRVVKKHCTTMPWTRVLGTGTHCPCSRAVVIDSDVKLIFWLQNAWNSTGYHYQHGPWTQVSKMTTASIPSLTVAEIIASNHGSTYKRTTRLNCWSRSIARRYTHKRSPISVLTELDVHADFR